MGELVKKSIISLLPNVLLVENDEISAMVAKSILEGLNCRVQTRTTGEEAIHAVKTEHYQLILMDVGLPTVNGLVVTKQIRNYEKNTLSDPAVILGLSGITDVNIKAKCYDAGMNGLLNKPLTRDIANDIIYKYLKGDRKNAVDLQEFTAVMGKIIHLDVLIDLIEKNKEHEKMRLMVDKTILSFADLCQKLLYAKTANQWEKIYDLVLQLCGECAYFGMERLHLACEQMMEGIHTLQGHHAYLEPMFEHLLHEINIAYSQYLELKERNIL